MEEEAAGGGGGAGGIVVVGDRSNFVIGLIENRAKEVTPLNPLPIPRIGPVRPSLSSPGFNFDRSDFRVPIESPSSRDAADSVEGIASGWYLPACTAFLRWIAQNQPAGWMIGFAVGCVFPSWVEMLSRLIDFLRVWGFQD